MSTINHKIYDNFYLSNEVEDQFNSHLDLQQFCTVDDKLVGTAGMIRKINVYTATSATEKLKMGQGNTKAIEVSHEQRDYVIELVVFKKPFNKTSVSLTRQDVQDALLVLWVLVFLKVYLKWGFGG